MKINFWSKRIGAASLATALIFTGNSLAGIGGAAAEETVAVVETTAATEPAAQPAIPLPTQPILSSGRMQACEEIGEIADGEHIFVYDPASAEMIYCRGGETDRLWPASITKVYAAYVALMYLSPETVVTAGEELALVTADSSRAYVTRGCRLTVKMLVEAMLLPSGSDASYVLAAAAGRAIAGDENIAGKKAVAVFIEEMNRQRTALGLRNSQFVNPDGYHHEDHYMCPADVAVVAALALENPVIAGYMGLQQDTVVYESGEHITWYSSNQLITPTSPYYSAYATGMKTGFTGEAGHCLLASFRRGDRTIIVGIFGSLERYPRYQTAVELFEACG